MTQMTAKQVQALVLNSLFVFWRVRVLTKSDPITRTEAPALRTGTMFSPVSEAVLTVISMRLTNLFR